MTRKTILTQCPICKKKISLSSPDFPFCSDRCRTLDLGNWADEKYVISEPLQAGMMEFDEDAD